jgi:hypothetical protein
MTFVCGNRMICVCIRETGSRTEEDDNTDIGHVFLHSETSWEFRGLFRLQRI